GLQFRQRLLLVGRVRVAGGSWRLEFRWSLEGRWRFGGGGTRSVGSETLPGAYFGQVIRREFVSRIQTHDFLKVWNRVVQGALVDQGDTEIQMGHGDVRFEAKDCFKFVAGLGGLAV